MDAWVDVDVGVTGLDGTAIHDIRDLAGVRFGFVSKVNLVKDKGWLSVSVRRAST